MADVFSIDDIGGDGTHNDAQSDDEDEQDSFQRWVCMRFVYTQFYFNLLLARQMTMLQGTYHACFNVTL